ncbi:MAG: hypothetical protein U1F52_13365 [Burkholderiales bacterium]
MSRRLLTRWLLAFMLVFAQQVGVVHAASHAPGHAPTHEHGKGVKMSVCDECVAAAHVQPAPGSAAQAPQFEASPVLIPARSLDGITARPCAAFRSRAPPVSA